MLSAAELAPRRGVEGRSSPLGLTLLPAGRDKDADAEARAAHSTLYATYWSRLRPLPGAADLLRACKQEGLAVVLASSADEP